MQRKYNYSATLNNGQITSQQDLVSGETISYQYDSLKRLIQASATGDPSGAWSQNFSYDGFGNLTTKTATNAPQLSVAVDWQTNRIQSFSGYDANGNMTSYAGDGYSYDYDNRMIQSNVSGVGYTQYGYDTTNHRVYKGALNSGTYSAEEFYFYGVEGHKYGTWKINPSAGILLQASVTKQWFGARLVSPEDRLGSKGRYFAFGEERTNITPANPSNDQEKFATYTRDAATGLDYANQRYFSSIIARFTKPDPYSGSANPASPQSWNRYSYVGNDPINLNDPDGLFEYDSLYQLPAGFSGGQLITLPVIVNVYGSVDNIPLSLMPGTTPYTGATPVSSGSPGGQSFSPGYEAASLALRNLQSIPFADGCDSYLHNTLGISLADVRNRATFTLLSDASAYTNPYGSSAFPNDRELAAAAQAQIDFETKITGTTIAQAVAASPNIHAISQYGGQLLFYNPTYFAQAGSATTLWTVFHEVLHQFRFDDRTLARAFGISDETLRSGGSEAISIWLASVCGVK